MISPQVVINSPENGARVSKTVTIEADASDNVMVQKVEFYIDVQLKYTDSIPSFSYAWDTTGQDGARTILVKAYDYAGNMASTSVSVTVNNSFYIGQPSASVKVAGNAVLTKVYVPNDSYFKVEIYLNDVKKGESSSVESKTIGSTTYYYFSTRWNSTEMANGQAVLKAVGYKGSSTEEDSINITIENIAGDRNGDGLYNGRDLVETASFGSNPGNLKMYRYVPSSITLNDGPRPLVVALHGCSQDAAGYANDTEWNDKAENGKFYVIYAQQKPDNNQNVCFSWFSAVNQVRGQREPLSIYQMVQKMKDNYLIDDSKVFITGFSAGGCMSSVMLSTYPDVFKGGGIIGGIAYKMA